MRATVQLYTELITHYFINGRKVGFLEPVPKTPPPRSGLMVQKLVPCSAIGITLALQPHTPFHRVQGQSRKEVSRPGLEMTILSGFPMKMEPGEFSTLALILAMTEMKVQEPT